MRMYELLFEADDKNIGIYCTGLCGEFAVALSETFGYKLGAIVQVTHDEEYDEDVKTFVHAFCYHPTNKTVGIDAVGMRPISEMMKDVFVDKKGKLVFEPTSKKELDELTMEGLWNESIEEAKKLIEQHKERYEVQKNNILYHVSTKKRWNSIKRNGLKMAMPQDTDNEEIGVYLFRNMDDVEDALMNWLGDRFDENEELIVIKVDGSYVNRLSPNAAGFELIVKNNIPKEGILGYEFI